MMTRHILVVLCGLGIATGAIPVAGAAAQPPDWAGRGTHDPARQVDRELFHYLLDNRAAISRRVTTLPQGVETLTEADDPAVVQKLRQHVRSMHRRMKDQRPIHMRDPLFAELFRHASQVEIVVETTERGVRVRQTSDDPYVAELIKTHAEVVSLFLANGHEEVRKNHPPPPRTVQP